MIHHLDQKIFNDPIHGHVELSPLSVKIIDTPQFQRLRDISQLGGTYFVFPGASSKRFEHSIGVSHLARKFVHRLHDIQPELNITYVDMLCVEIAGLCHDLGHGPFSHLFDGKVLPALNPSSTFVHEHASIGIFEILVHENNLMPEFQKYGLGVVDVHFIQELILGDPEEAPEGFEWVGRGAAKEFLYDIVANKRNGIDVDKFDYFARDCNALGVTKSFDASRLMMFARVCAVERAAEGSPKNKRVSVSRAIGETAGEFDVSSSISRSQQQPQFCFEICFHSKEAWNLFELFHTRYALHKRAYQHRVSQAAELMLSEALILADPFIHIQGRRYTDAKEGQLVSSETAAGQAPSGSGGGEGAEMGSSVDGGTTRRGSSYTPCLRRMSECPQDLHAYWRLTEYVLLLIEHSPDEDLAKAKNVVQRLRCRDLFPFVGELILSPSHRDDIMRQGSDMDALSSGCRTSNNRNNNNNNNNATLSVSGKAKPKRRKLTLAEIVKEQLWEIKLKQDSLAKARTSADGIGTGKAANALAMSPQRTTATATTTTTIPVVVPALGSRSSSAACRKRRAPSLMEASAVTGAAVAGSDSNADVGLGLQTSLPSSMEEARVAADGDASEECMDFNASEADVKVNKEDIFCVVMKLGYGKAKQNPVSDLTTFYRPMKTAPSSSISFAGPSSSNNNSSIFSGASVSIGAKANAASASWSDLNQANGTRPDNQIDTVSTAGSGSAGNGSSDEAGLFNPAQFACLNDGLLVGVVPQDSVSRLIPREFEETYIRIFCRHKVQSAAVGVIFREWCRSNAINAENLTPHKRARHM